MGTSALDLDDGADFDDLIGRQLEIGAGALRVFGKPAKQPFSPEGHARAGGRKRIGAAQEIRELLQRDGEVGPLDGFEKRRHIGRLHETVPEGHPIDARLKLFGPGLMRRCDHGNTGGADREEQNVLVEDFVMAHVLDQGGRGEVRGLSQIDRAPGHARRV